MRLGQVAPNGVVYFHHKDIDECRAFLRDNGLDIHLDRPIWRGWHSQDNMLSGLINHDGQSWYAGYWKAT